MCSDSPRPGVTRQYLTELIGLAPYNAQLVAEADGFQVGMVGPDDAIGVSGVVVLVIQDQTVIGAGWDCGLGSE